MTAAEARQRLEDIKANNQKEAAVKEINLVYEDISIALKREQNFSILQRALPANVIAILEASQFKVYRDYAIHPNNTVVHW